MSTQAKTMAAKLTLKLLINKQTHKVVFGESDKNFVDFLLSLLILPIGTVSKLLADPNMVGSLGKLCQGLENLAAEYLQPNVDKSTLLNPRVFTTVTGPGPPLLLPNEAATPTSKYYLCSQIQQPSGAIRHGFVADVKGTKCNYCGNIMTIEVPYIASKPAGLESDGGGYVKGVVTYMVTDDLVVTPMSGVSCIALLGKFHIKDVTVLEERVVEVGMEEGLALLKALLESKTVLSDVFGGKVIHME